MGNKCQNCQAPMVDPIARPLTFFALSQLDLYSEPNFHVQRWRKRFHCVMYIITIVFRLGLSQPAMGAALSRTARPSSEWSALQCTFPGLNWITARAPSAASQLWLLKIQVTHETRSQTVYPTTIQQEVLELVSYILDISNMMLTPHTIKL